ncbi:MAG TPA: hypothetical protein VD866_32225 [Urbifossiella sp.]|nr:hypothetical protein [Urbifossiella sp.]
MTCPTCDHTLTGIGYGMAHCPRCGTLAHCPADGAVAVPALVARCRRFETSLRAAGNVEVMAPDLVGDWRQLGIREAINRPGDRP